MSTVVCEARPTHTAPRDVMQGELSLSWAMTTLTESATDTTSADDYDVIDLFAGPGGWDEGLRRAYPGLRVLGIEVDNDACATATAAGHNRLCADVTTLDPRDYLSTAQHHSPVCTPFSKLGRGKGRLDAPTIIEAVRFAVDQQDTIPRLIASFEGRAHDPKSVLTLEPLRWIAANLPRFVTMEQVREVMPVWEAYADTLRAWGYNVWVGTVHSEQYGTPQARARAILLARRDGLPVTPPVPTHSRFHTRSPSRLDPGVLPWVSMADALGIAADETDPAARRAAVAAWAEPKVNNQSGTEFDLAWPLDRPAPTVAGRGLVGMPGANANRYNGSTKSRNDGIYIEPWEAGVLQGFPAAYPWTGSRGSQFQQIGNAVPPPLSAALTRHLFGSDPAMNRAVTIDQPATAGLPVL